VAELQGRSNYLSVTRLAEELEDALAEDTLLAARAWMLALLVRFAESSRHGNLEELGYIPRALDEYLDADGAALRVFNTVRSSVDDGRPPAGAADFYGRARENATRADLVVVNHALLLNQLLKSTTTRAGDGAQEGFAQRVICDEAHTLEEAATLVLEQRVEQRGLQRLLRDVYEPRGARGLIAACRRVLRMPADSPALQETARAADEAQAALDELAARLRHYVSSQTVVSGEELQRYGVRVPIASGALSAAGGPALRTAAEALGGFLTGLREALARLAAAATEALDAEGIPQRRGRRVVHLAKGLLREMRESDEQYSGFWSFRDPGGTVRVVELERVEGKDPSGRRLPPPVTIRAVPINVGPLLWERVWSRLEAAVFTSATVTVAGQGFDFFLGRVGLEPHRVQAAAPEKRLTTRQLPHVFNYHEQALLMLPGDLPAPRDTALKREFPDAVADLLLRFIPFFGGRSLGLFTANARRDRVFERIRDDLAHQGFPVLCQGQGGLQRLIEEFRSDPARSLLGTRSLWEGVDVPGESLSYLFLEKLPYPSIGDPVEAARMNAVEAAGGEPFYDYLLPKMVIQLKQGFGRLIRGPQDHGGAVLLDKRLRSAMYRAEVLASLPNPTLGYESGVELFRRIAEWMGIPFDPSELPAPTVTDLARVLAEQQLSAICVSADEFDAVARPRLLAVQQAVWGQDTFRPGQEEIMRAVLAGKDQLSLLPTGAGKSRTYQLPALIRPGLTLVVSPLIALIRDQVEKLREIPGMTCVAALVSGMDAASQEEVLQAAGRGELKLLYVSPERLRDPRFRAYLPRLPLVELVVDEAHCISTWGHDFRPDFLDVAELLPADAEGTRLPVHGLTATATAQVQQEIIAALRMGEDGRELAIYSGDFTRDNLVFRVYTVAQREERDALALGIVHQLVRNTEQGGAGIIYVATRREAVRLARLLRDRNIAASAYHGGMSTPERHQVQELFMQGEIEVVVATNAFGMGVDKPNIRFVLHYDHPSSLEAYVQEAGRAGRDGLEAYAILLNHPGAQRTARFIARQGIPQADLLNAYRRALQNADRFLRSGARLENSAILCDPEELAQVADVEPTQARVLLFSFEEAGLVIRGPDCTLEAALLLNQQPGAILAALPDHSERALAAALLAHTGAEPDRQVKYRAGEFFRDTGHDPCRVDPLLNRLAERSLLLYRPYSRGVTLMLSPDIRDPARLEAIEQRYAARYRRFEERLEAMLDYIRLRPGQSRCRSTFLVNYITGRQDGVPCGKCDLCSPTAEDLPWDPGLRLYGEPLQVDVRLAILGATRDHDGWFGRWTIEKMLLGIPQTTFEGQRRQLSPTALASDHFGGLRDTGANEERVRRTLDALIEGGYLILSDKEHRGAGTTYSAVSITQKGRDALAGGVSLPEFPAGAA
jgi:ATP-dependent DNA helicase RecQ